MWRLLSVVVIALPAQAQDMGPNWSTTTYPNGVRVHSTLPGLVRQPLPPDPSPVYVPRSDPVIVDVRGFPPGYVPPAPPPAPPPPVVYESPVYYGRHHRPDFHPRRPEFAPGARVSHQPTRVR